MEPGVKIFFFTELEANNTCFHNLCQSSELGVSEARKDKIAQS
jgi:hypothetical protein